MRRPRTAGMFVGLLALPVALLGALPAVAWHLPDGLPFGREDATEVVHGAQHQRGHKVRITGAAQGPLYPGGSARVALKFQNPSKHKVRMQRVRVKITGVVAPNSDAAHPCTAADFAIRQMPRRTVLRVPARRTTDLGAMHIPIAAWPQLTMVNRPLNQDGCKDAEVRLRFKARGLRR